MNPWMEPGPQGWRRVVDDALSEDVGPGDVSSGVLPAELLVDWYIEGQQDGVVCGLGIVEYVLGPGVNLRLKDGDSFKEGQTVAEGRAYAREALTAERTALNFLTLLSGVATLTRQFAAVVEGTGARIVDTRKTIPLLRSLQKYAVRCGGGYNHRVGLFDGAMLKDNHIRAAGSIREAVRMFRARASHMTKLEVECETLEQVDEAVLAGADVVLLDNMDCSLMREAVNRYKGSGCLFEASGGINLKTVREVAETGVDLISVGALTHSAPSAAFHMEIS